MRGDERRREETRETDWYAWCGWYARSEASTAPWAFAVENRARIFPPSDLDFADTF